MRDPKTLAWSENETSRSLLSVPRRAVTRGLLGGPTKAPPPPALVDLQGQMGNQSGGKLELLCPPYTKHSPSLPHTFPYFLNISCAAKTWQWSGVCVCVCMELMCWYISNSVWYTESKIYPKLPTSGKMIYSYWLPCGFYSVEKTRKSEFFNTFRNEREFLLPSVSFFVFVWPCAFLCIKQDSKTDSLSFHCLHSVKNQKGRRVRKERDSRGRSSIHVWYAALAQWSAQSTQ